MQITTTHRAEELLREVGAAANGREVQQLLESGPTGVATYDAAHRAARNEHAWQAAQAARAANLFLVPWEAKKQRELQAYHAVAVRAEYDRLAELTGTRPAWVLSR